MFKKLLLILLFVILTPLIASSTQKELVTLTATGSTTDHCNVNGYSNGSMSIDLQAGTATVKVEVRGCNTSDGVITTACPWLFLSDADGVDISVTADHIVGFAGYGFADMRINVTVCAGCTVVATCNYWKYSK